MTGPTVIRLFRKLDWKTQQRILEVRSLLRRRGGDRRFNYSVKAVRATSKHTDPVKVLDRLLRYQKALGYEIDFKGKAVLELGAGPVLGWALTALSLGAARYVALDPSFNPDVLRAVPEYFNEQRRWLAAVGDDPGDPVDLIRDGRIQVIRASGAGTGVDSRSIDLVLSNSVLEHVLELDDVVLELGRVSATNAEQVHFVDFTDHHARRDPFESLYLHHPDEIRRLFKQRGLYLNMMRPSEVEKAIAGAGPVRRTVLIHGDGYPSVRSPHPWWAERYEQADLAIEVAAFHVERTAAGEARRS